MMPEVLRINQILKLAVFCSCMLSCQESTFNNQQPNQKTNKKERKLDFFFDEHLMYVNVPDTSGIAILSILNNGFFCSYPEEPISAVYGEKDKKEHHSIHNQPEKISEKEFNSLSALEHFVYAFKHPESYSQSCSIIRTPKN